MKVLVEGMKSVGKSTNYNAIDIDKYELINKLKNNEDFIVDRMFIKEYVYDDRGFANNLIAAISVFDKIIIVLPKNFNEYEEMFKDRIYNDNEFKTKINKTLSRFKFKDYNANFKNFNILTMMKYIKFILALKEHADHMEVTTKKHNINVLEYTFYFKKGEKNDSIKFNNCCNVLLHYNKVHETSI